MQFNYHIRDLVEACSCSADISSICGVAGLQAWFGDHNAADEGLQGEHQQTTEDAQLRQMQQQHLEKELTQSPDQLEVQQPLTRPALAIAIGKQCTAT